MPAATRAQAGATPIAEDLGAREGLRHSAPPRQSLFKGDAEKDGRTGKRRGRRSHNRRTTSTPGARRCMGGEGGVGGQTDLLDPGEMRFWRALLNSLPNVARQLGRRGMVHEASLRALSKLCSERDTVLKDIVEFYGLVDATAQGVTAMNGDSIFCYGICPWVFWSCL